MTMFHVGQKVVCVRGPLFGAGDVEQPEVNAVYTVRSTYVDQDDGCAGIRLVEIRLPLCRHGTECGYYAVRFRPVRTTSIEIFERMLLNVPIKETVA